MHTSEYDFLFKLLLIGDSGVGKVCPGFNSLLSTVSHASWCFSVISFPYSLACFCDSLTTHTPRVTSAPLESTSRFGPSSWKERRSNCKSWVVHIYRFTTCRAHGRYTADEIVLGVTGVVYEPYLGILHSKCSLSLHMRLRADSLYPLCIYWCLFCFFTIVGHRRSAYTFITPENVWNTHTLTQVKNDSAQSPRLTTVAPTVSSLFTTSRIMVSRFPCHSSIACLFGPFVQKLSQMSSSGCRKSTDMPLRASTNSSWVTNQIWRARKSWNTAWRRWVNFIVSPRISHNRSFI